MNTYLVIYKNVELGYEEQEEITTINKSIARKIFKGTFNTCCKIVKIIEK